MKTLKLIDKYIKLLEQDSLTMPQEPDQPAQPDATDINTQPEEQEVRPLSSEGEKELVMLLVQAFAHAPTDQELKIVDAINQELGTTNPKEVAETISKLLNSSSTGDKQMIDRIDKQ